ncbi:MAG: carbohydrate ABC transporter substrate-binding protein [Bacilli bacterium]|nr:carbohydrate ABC transporter substrate-binding protein [Bacilli bacterium]
MKKKLLVGLLAASAVAGVATGCSESKHYLNIHCWNDEFQGRFRAYSTEYEKTLSNGTDLLKDGTIVRWVITPNDNNAYQNALDAALEGQDSAKANDKVDVFLAEADYIIKYSKSSKSLDVKADIGLTDEDLKDNYAYTQDIASYDGKLKGVTWQATPGLFAYRRDIATEVLGSDDPATVQAALADWDKFDAVAASMKAKNYFMLSGYDDAYRTFSNNMSKPWVDSKGEVTIDANIKRWVDQTKDYTDKGYNNKTSLWSEQWGKDQGPDGKVFGFFYSTWGINFTLLGNSLADADGEKKVGNGLYGKYGVVEGPQSYYWGGTWIMAAKGTDDKDHIKQLMKDFASDKTIAEAITRETEDYTNNKTAMHTIATDSSYGSAFLGGQNHVALFEESAKKISMKNMTAYDQGCNEKFQNAMKNYFDGTMTYEEALAEFETNLKEVYPALSFNFEEAAK